LREGVVVDSSVVIKWFLKNEPLADLAEKLLEMFRKGERPFIIPDLLFYEVGNVFLRKWPQSTAIVEKTLARLWSLPWFLMPLGESLLIRTLRLAGQYQTSYYDTLFLSTAETTNSILYSADEKFVKKVQEIPFVKSLKSLQ